MLRVNRVSELVASYRNILSLFVGRVKTFGPILAFSLYATYYYLNIYLISTGQPNLSPKGEVYILAGLREAFGRG
jgi:hypothetical protein